MTRPPPTLRRLSLALAAAGCLSLAACDKLADAVQKGAEAAAGDAAQAGMSEDDKLGAKLKGYVDCINWVSDGVHRSADGYASWVDFDKGLDPATKNPGSVYEINDPQKCLDAVTAAKAMEPKLEDVEGAADAYVTALNTLIPLVKEAHKYYDEKNYKDDAFNKGVELDPKLRAAFEAFNAADEQLRTAVRTHNEALHERELARIEKEEGRKLPFLTRFVMQESKGLVAVLRAADSFESIDMAKMDEAFKAFEGAVDECTKYAEAHKAEADSITLFSSFTSDADELKKETKELLRRKRDGKPFTDKENADAAQWTARAPDGHPLKIYEMHDDLIKSSNSLGWNFYKPQ